MASTRVKFKGMEELVGRLEGLPGELENRTWRQAVKDATGGLVSEMRTHLAGAQYQHLRASLGEKITTRKGRVIGIAGPRRGFRYVKDQVRTGPLAGLPV